jgi:molybdate transport system substrate-binding protein
MLVAFGCTHSSQQPSPSPSEVKVLISGGFSAAYQELLPQFEKGTGITVTTTPGVSQGNDPATISAQLRRGVPADVVILSREGLADLLAEGRITAGSDVDLARVPLGVGVRAGTPRPDISTVDAFKKTLLRAKSIGVESTSGVYLKTIVFPKLGIADTLADRLSDAAAAEVASRQVEMVVLPNPLLLIDRSLRGCSAFRRNIPNPSYPCTYFNECLCTLASHYHY